MDSPAYDVLSGILTPAQNDTSPTPLDPNAAPSQPNLPAPQPRPLPVAQPTPNPADQPGAFIPNDNSSPSPAAAPQPRLWTRILAGALDGLAGAGRYGARSFGAGIGAGAAGYQDAQQQQVANQQRQQQIDNQTSQIAFANKEAAARVAYMNADAVRQGQLNADHQRQLDAINQQSLDHYKTLGITPVLIASEDGNDATEALRKAGQMYNGQIPPLSAINVSGQWYVFDASQIATAESEKGRQLYNDYVFQTTGKRNAIDESQWGSLDKRVAAAKIDQALQWNAMSPAQDLTPQRIDSALARTKNELSLFAYNAAKNDPQAQSIIKQKQQELALYQSYKDQLSADADKAADRQADVRVAAVEAKANAQKNAPPKIDNMVIGLQDGRQVAGTADELRAAGATSITKAPSETVSKVIAARELTGPDGLFNKISGELQALGPQNLGPVVGRWNEFMAGKLGTGPQYVELRNDLGLLSTKLMQAHVGSRGSISMLDHFKSMSDAGKMDFPTLASALHGEYQYVDGISMRPKAKGGK